MKIKISVRNRKLREKTHRAYVHSHIPTFDSVERKRVWASAFSDDWPQNQIWMAAFFCRNSTQSQWSVWFVVILLFLVAPYNLRHRCCRVVVFIFSHSIFFSLVHSISSSFNLSWRWLIATTSAFFFLLLFLLVFVWFWFCAILVFHSLPYKRTHVRMQTRCIPRTYTIKYIQNKMTKIHTGTQIPNTNATHTYVHISRRERAQIQCKHKYNVNRLCARDFYSILWWWASLLVRIPSYTVRIVIHNYTSTCDWMVFNW